MTPATGTSSGGPPEFDLLVVGMGPTGATLAGLAARRGLRVVAVERDAALFPLPRAVQCDHEVLRILQELGCADEVLDDCIINAGMDFLAADRQVLLSFSVPGEAPTGWPTSVFFHQPTFEAVLRRTVAALGVDVRLGCGVATLDQDDGGVHAVLEDGRTVRARWAVGCDGARSATRRTIGTGLRDTGFEESWLVVDLILPDGAPDLADRCLQVCDPARPHTLVPMPGRRFRFEFMLLPGEDPVAIQAPGVITGLVSGWVDPVLVEVERAAVYTFHGLVAATWRDRRVFVAGDAAHQTPPFLGQGMCAGLRDAANLAWKLAAVASGAPDWLLDTYQVEREPHARTVIDLAVEFGRLICTTDPVVAAERDAAMSAERSEPTEVPTLLPPLAAGVAVGAGGGDLSSQPRIDGRRMDDLTGTGFVLVAARPPAIGSPASDWWARHGTVLDATVHPELTGLLDGEPACVLRPDRYVLGRGSVDELTSLAGRLLGS